MTQFTRRDLLRGATAGAVVVGWDPVTRSWATAGRRRSLHAIPGLDGVLLTDPASRALAADDYGNHVHHEPVAVLRPLSVGDIIKVVDYARERRISVSMRGQAHSAYGQSMARDGIVIDSATLCRIHEIRPDRAVVDPGVTFRQLVAAGVVRGVTPPALTDFQGLSVGGVLSIGGVDSGPMKHGAIVDNVLELQVVTGEGDLVTCSPNRRNRLFESVLAGLGQCGVIVRATLRMVPAPTNALLVKLRYEDLHAYLSDQAMLVRDGRFDAFEAWGLWENGRWIYEFQGAKYFDLPAVPDGAALYSGLRDVPASRVAAPIPYLAWTARLDPLVPLLTATKMALYNPLLPEKGGPEFLADLLTRTPDDLGGDRGLFVIGRSANVGMPLVTLPDSDVFFAYVHSRGYDTPEQAKQFLADNRRLYDRQVALGGKRYPWDAIPDLTRADWKRHFGDQWGFLKRSKQLYDPTGILGPGHGIFA